jgi:hypothetical protein
MANGMFGSIKALRDDVAALDRAVLRLIRGQDEAARCLRVILSILRRLHDASARQEVRRRAVHRKSKK